MRGTQLNAVVPVAILIGSFFAREFSNMTLKECIILVWEAGWAIKKNNSCTAKYKK